MDTLVSAKRILVATDGWFPFTIHPEAVTTDEFAMAGLVRCRRLLQGMIQVHDSPDLAGCFARPLYEAYLSSMYLLLDGNDAFARLEANDNYELRRIAKRILDVFPSDDPHWESNREQSETTLAAPPSPGKRIDLAALGIEVRRKLLDNEDPNAEWPVTMYTVLFATESYSTAHGGIGAFKPYMLHNREVSSCISAESWSHSAHDRRLDVMTAAVLSLALKVGVALRTSTSEVENFANEWLGTGETQ